MKDLLQKSLKEAIKSKNSLKRDTIRSIVSAIQYVEMDKGTEDLNSSEYISILKTELKKRAEELEFAEKANRDEQISQLKIEQEIILSFLPSQLSEEELKSKISAIISSQESANIGSVMKALKSEYDGQYDGKLASQIIKDCL